MNPYILTQCPSTANLTYTSTNNTPKYDFRILKISFLKEVIQLPMNGQSTTSNDATNTTTSVFATTSPSVSYVQMERVQAREIQAYRETQQFLARIGVGVTVEAQEIFDALSKTLPVRWVEEKIVVLDEVIINPPYDLENCKAGSSASGSLARVRKVLEGEKKRLSNLAPYFTDIESNNTLYKFYKLKARINQQFSSLSSIIPTTTIKSSFSTQSRRVFTNITNTQLKQRIIMSGTGTLIPQTLKNNINNVTPDSNGHLLSPNNASPNRNYSTSSHDENNLDNTKDSGHSNNHAELTRWSLAWWKEWTIIFIVFGITGSTTVRCVRPIVTNLLGIEGSFLEGPWSYRLTYLSITLPLYSLILLIIGTIAGRHAFFKNVVVRMWGRLIPTRLINVAKRRE
ncbi:6993_t:CDS:2 [Ambispora gerdemannii]|uniref:6993_t:CDS:1 n=1 Tax=Ambispora gerdemannii TaxID=144530 RepID=A0A9N9AM89_9GLOM|nr:6993_t:CDS:2 [Ambispora gerdemannii]